MLQYEVYNLPKEILSAGTKSDVVPDMEMEYSKLIK